MTNLGVWEWRKGDEFCHFDEGWEASINSDKVLQQVVVCKLQSRCPAAEQGPRNWRPGCQWMSEPRSLDTRCIEWNILLVNVKRPHWEPEPTCTNGMRSIFRYFIFLSLNIQNGAAASLFSLDFIFWLMAEASHNLHVDVPIITAGPLNIVSKWRFACNIIH